MVDNIKVGSSIQKLNSYNYAVWSYKVELLLCREKTWSVIRDELPSEDKRDVTWKDKNDQARSTIGLLVEDAQLVHIRNLNTAKEVWNALKDFHQKSSMTSIVLLLKSVCRAQLHENGDMEAHITFMQETINKLTALGFDLTDTVQAALYLASLPDSYDSLVTTIEGKDMKDISCAFVKSKLMDEYRKRVGSKDIRSSTNSNEEAAMKASYNYQAGQKGGQQGKKPYCHFCKKTGHVKRECTAFKAHKEKKEQAKCAVDDTNKAEEKAEICLLVQEKNEACLKATVGNNGWIVDSGATSHMANDMSAFISMDPKRKGNVRLADEKNLVSINGIGDISLKCDLPSKIKNSLEASDVLYVPSLSSNLLSVKKLAKDGYKLIFENNTCHILKNEQLRAIATLNPELYELNFITERDRACTAVAQKDHTKNCIHE